MICAVETPTPRPHLAVALVPFLFNSGRSFSGCRIPERLERRVYLLGASARRSLLKVALDGGLVNDLGTES